MKINDSDIVEKLKNGDSKEKESAFKILVSDYKERLYWHIRKIVIDHDDAIDSKFKRGAILLHCNSNFFIFDTGSTEFISFLLKFE